MLDISILALSCNVVHKLWKWQKTERNASGKATALVAAQVWKPASGILMTNDSYVMSASGGKISLFNMMTFKTMATFITPPPASTYLAFHLQVNNVIVIGMGDCSIQIYNVRIDEIAIVCFEKYCFIDYILYMVFRCRYEI